MLRLERITRARVGGVVGLVDDEQHQLACIGYKHLYGHWSIIRYLCFSSTTVSFFSTQHIRNKACGYHKIGRTPTPSNATQTPRRPCTPPYLGPVAIFSHASTTPAPLFSNTSLSRALTLPSTYRATTSGSRLSGRPMPTPTRHHFVFIRLA